MAWERQEAMDWLHGPNRRSNRLSGLDSGAASSLFLALEREGCTVEVLAEDVVDGEAAAVVLTVPASARGERGVADRAGRRRRARDGAAPGVVSDTLVAIILPSRPGLVPSLLPDRGR